MTENKYRVIFTKSAERELKKLTNQVIVRLIPVIKNLSDNPRPSGCIKLEGSSNRYRVRVGDYRILYEIEDKIKIVEIVGIRNRREAYE
ncbi:type II toxin-antitoxin system RelE/ParE family toxin [Runella sp.]|uniref:type II toxin-antitoxin system RelE family toxin n=1 Tax=Runella sp. TaxID=1960881 RepID=UPI002635C74A|nr:type II toxin-antitoxin system RelE/ParE family toxin [Runella sp.]